MQYTRLYTDAAGVSHFAEVVVPVSPAAYAPPAPPLHVSTFLEATRVGFLQEASGWDGGWHPSPRRQFVLVLGGAFEIEVGDGERRAFGPGAVLLLEDTTGRGHASRFTGGEDCVVALVHLPG